MVPTDQCMYTPPQSVGKVSVVNVYKSMNETGHNEIRYIEVPIVRVHLFQGKLVNGKSAEIARPPTYHAYRLLIVKSLNIKIITSPRHDAQNCPTRPPDSSCLGLTVTVCKPRSAKYFLLIYYFLDFLLKICDKII